MNGACRLAPSRRWPPSWALLRATRPSPRRWKRPRPISIAVCCAACSTPMDRCRARRRRVSAFASARMIWNCCKPSSACCCVSASPPRSIESGGRPGSVRCPTAEGGLRLYDCAAQHELAIAGDNVGLFRRTDRLCRPRQVAAPSGPSVQLSAPAQSRAVRRRGRQHRSGRRGRGLRRPDSRHQRLRRQWPLCPQLRRAAVAALRRLPAGLDQSRARWSRIRSRRRPGSTWRRWSGWCRWPCACSTTWSTSRASRCRSRRRRPRPSAASASASPASPMR